MVSMQNNTQTTHRLLSFNLTLINQIKTKIYVPRYIQISDHIYNPPLFYRGISSVKIVLVFEENIKDLAF